MIEKLIENGKEVENLPFEIKEFLGSPDTLKKFNELCLHFKLNEEQEKKLKSIVLGVAKGEIEMHDMPSLIEEGLSVLFIKAANIDDKLYQDLLFDIEDKINAQHEAHQAAKPKEEPIVQKADIEEAKEEKEGHIPLINKAIAKFGLFPPSVIPAQAGIQPEKLKERFYQISETFLNEARTKSQFKNTIKKKIKAGGMGFDGKTAEAVASFFASRVRVKALEEKRKKEEKIGERQKIESLKTRDLEKEEPPPTLPSQGGEKEAAASAPLPPPPAVSSTPLPPPPELPKEFREQIKKERAEKQKPSIKPPTPVPPPEPPPEKKPPNQSLPLEKGGQEGFNNKEKKFINPPQPSFSKGGGDEVGFESEEKEAEELKSKVEELKTTAPQAESEDKAQKALEEINISFPSAELQKRLRDIINARLRNVRTPTQTFERLILEAAKGGVGLSKEEADKVSLILNKYLEEGSKDLYKSKVAEVKEFEAKVRAQGQEKAQKEKEGQQKKLDEKFETLTAGRKVKKTKKQIPTPSKPLPPPSKPLPPPYAPSAPLPPRSLPPKTPRPALEDIKFTPKLTGPVQEIGRMTLDDFRKMSSDPKEAILKIKDKLSLLREQSFKDYQAGIDAWYKSPLYKEYVNIFSQSLKSGTPLEELLKSSQTLNKNEFDAIIDSRIE